MKFNEILKNKKLLEVLEQIGFETPTEIQEKIIPLILDGNDVLGQSQTGTGKTLAFTAPILETIEENKKLQTLVLAPTRELAIQIATEIEKYAARLKVRVTCVYGSSSIQMQIQSIKKGSEIVIGTPGRVKDLIERRVLRLSEIKYFVLDEADEMLSMGFQEELEYIFKKTNNDRQVLLFSATMPKPILTMARKYMSSDYETVSVIQDIKTAEHIEQKYYIVQDQTRLEAMCRVMDYYHPNRSIIFSRTKKQADELKESLAQRGYSVDVIHGDITQTQRISTLERFKAGIFQYLIATDVAARGIHVEDIELVINYNFPESNEAYVHRIGRTGRANKSGMAITFIKESERKKINFLERHIKRTIAQEKVPTMEDVLPNHVERVLTHLHQLKDKPTKFDLFDENLDQLSVAELKRVISLLLEKELKETLGSDFNVNITEKRKKKGKESRHRDLDDKVRVFVTIGKLDRINKKEFLDFIEKKAGVRQGSCSGIEILTKFTFMNIKDTAFDKVMKNCNNITYKGRKIRIEKAK